jgi:hypothetical protein
MSSEQDPPVSESGSGAHEPLVSPLKEGEDQPAGAGGSEVAPASTGTPPPPSSSSTAASAHHDAPNMLPGRERRRTGVERLLVRLIATCGIVGIGVAIGAIMVSSKSQGWLIGLVVSLVSVILAAILWSSRTL